jgi:SNF2 family DNA or RNA helicase
MKTVTIEKDVIYFEATDQVAKQLDGIYVKSRSRYKIPYTLGALRELWRFGYDVEPLGKQKAEELTQLRARKENPAPTLDGLRTYQAQDIYFLSSIQPGAAIFNEMRLGKTPTALKLMEIESHYKIMVICPSSLVLNWEKEVQKWTNYDCLPVIGTRSKRQKIYEQWNKGFLVLSKDTAKLDVDLIRDSNYALIVDEAHFLRNYKTAQSKAVFQLGKKANRRLALTGTPSMNKPDDVYGILHFLYPERFSSYWQFIDRYFQTWGTPWGSRELKKDCYKRKKELQEILEEISVQRKRAEVMQWLPKKTYQTFEVEMEKKQRKAYQDMLELFAVEGTEIDAPSVLAQLTRLRQLCLAPEVLGIEAPSAKESFLMEWLEDNANESVIVFSHFSSYLRMLQPRIKGSKLIIGDTSKKERQQVVESFQDGKTKVILANIEAAGVGLTLDAGSTIIFLDRSYVPAMNEQAEDRIIPTTQERNHQSHIIDIVCRDSIDQKIHNLLQAKINITQAINHYRSVKEFMET